MERTVVALSALLLFLGVGCGAFGAHALKEVLSAEMKVVYQTAVFYHLVHALGAFVPIILGRLGFLSTHGGVRIALFFLTGVVIFSGSLYALTLTGITVLGAITPIGGTLFLIGWASLAWMLFRHRENG